MRPFTGRIELFLWEVYRAQTRMTPDRGWRRWAEDDHLPPLHGEHQRCLLVDHACFGRQIDAWLPGAPLHPLIVWIQPSWPERQH
jgi:hypothetical protein